MFKYKPVKNTLYTHDRNLMCRQYIIIDKLSLSHSEMSKIIKIIKENDTPLI